MKNIRKYFKKHNLGILYPSIRFKELTTIKCGGEISYTYYPDTYKNLIKAYKYILKHKINYFIISGGSNCLASDDKFMGVVIGMKHLERKLIIKKNKLIVSSSYQTTNFAYKMARLKYGDFSYLAGIPGLIGGAIYNNSGAFGKSILDDVISVTYIDNKGHKKCLKKKKLKASYRYSIFHKMNSLILSVEFNYEKNIETLDKITLNLKERRRKQPLDSYSLGSVFKNTSEYKAYQIIDKLGLRGYKFGDFMVSVKHANFIINLGNGKSEDFLSIVKLIKDKSKEELGIILEDEFVYINSKYIENV